MEISRCQTPAAVTRMSILHPTQAATSPASTSQRLGRQLLRPLLRYALPLSGSMLLLLAIALLMSTPLLAASEENSPWSLPAAPGQQLQLTVSGATVTAAQLAQLTQQLEQGWQLLAARQYWPAARQFATTGQWPANAALLQRAWQQCERWWQLQRSYHCRFGEARQQWQALLAAPLSATQPDGQPEQSAADTSLPNISMPDRVSSRRQARQWLQQNQGVLPDLQQFATAVLLDAVWQQSQLFWPKARQLQLQFNDWLAVAGSALAHNVSPLQQLAMSQIQLKDAVLLSSNNEKPQLTVAGRYSPVWLINEAWPVPAGPVVKVVAHSFSEAWLSAQALVASPASQRRELSGRYAAWWYEHHAASGTTVQSTTSQPQASALWYPLLQDQNLHQAVSLSLSIELPAQGPSSKRPYVSVWIQPDPSVPSSNIVAANTPLQQQLLLLGEQVRWYPELRSWWRAIKPLLPGSAEQQQQQLQQMVDQWAGATRKAGVHQFDWPARRADGQPLTPGAYQLLVEAAREGGGRELVKLKLRWPLATGQQLQARGQHELGLVELQVR